ncbi:unnamed protein product, partial [Mesorhabditis spiculigera]
MEAISEVGPSDEVLVAVGGSTFSSRVSDLAEVPSFKDHFNRDPDAPRARLTLKGHYFSSDGVPTIRWPGVDLTAAPYMLRFLKQFYVRDGPEAYDIVKEFEAENAPLLLIRNEARSNGILQLEVACDKVMSERTGGDPQPTQPSFFEKAAIVGTVGAAAALAMKTFFK